LYGNKWDHITPRAVRIACVPLYQTVLLYDGHGVWLPHLKQSLLLDQHAFLQVPEVEMGFAAGHYDVAVCRVKVCSEHRLVGALRRKHTTRPHSLPQDLSSVPGGVLFNPPVTFIFTDIFYPWGQFDPSN